MQHTRYTKATILKNIIEDRDNLNKLMDVIYSSAQLQYITLPNKKTFRGGIHCMIYGNVGVGKSTDLFKACELFKVSPIYSISKSHLFGSVDKNTSLHIYPVTWTNRRSIIAMDEFSFDHRNSADKEILSSLLSLMEYPIFKKHIGYRCNDILEKDGDLYFKVKNNVINIKTSFTIIMTTMFNPSRVQNIMMKALVSRCIVIPYFPSKEDIYDEIENNKSYNPKLYKVKIDNYKFTKKNYSRIVEFVKTQDVENSLIKRTIGDIARAYAILGKWDEKIFKTISDLKYVYNISDINIKNG